LPNSNKGIQIGRSEIKSRLVEDKRRVEVIDQVLGDQRAMGRGIQILAPPVTPEHQKEIREAFVVSGDHAAFDRGHLMAKIEGKAGHISE
jgi:hypothetical protein